MKKLTIKLNYHEISALDHWLDTLLSEAEPVGYAHRCVWATLVAWRIAKVHPKTHYTTQDKITLKLDIPTAMALASLVSLYPPSHYTQLGNRLYIISDEINQHFQ